MKIFTSVVKGRFARALNVLFRLLILTLVFLLNMELENYAELFKRELKTHFRKG